MKNLFVRLGSGRMLRIVKLSMLQIAGIAVFIPHVLFCWPSWSQTPGLPLVTSACESAQKTVPSLALRGMAKVLDMSNEHKVLGGAIVGMAAVGAGYILTRPYVWSRKDSRLIAAQKEAGDEKLKAVSAEKTLLQYKNDDLQRQNTLQQEWRTFYSDKTDWKTLEDRVLHVEKECKECVLNTARENEERCAKISKENEELRAILVAFEEHSGNVDKAYKALDSRLTNAEGLAIKDTMQQEWLDLFFIELGIKNEQGQRVVTREEAKKKIQQFVLAGAQGRESQS